MKVQVEGVGPYELGPNEFVAAGGEGKVYAVGDLAIKVFDDPKLAPPPDKLRALSSLTDPRVLAPQSIVTTPRGRFVGYCMPFVESATAMARVCTAGFQRRQRISKKRLREIAEAMRGVIEYVHAAGVLIVDLSDNNVLLGADRQTPYFIDVDSWQTPHHPATAVTPSIRDPLVGGGPHCFGPGSDWFSFGVLAFSLLVGIHPFKGKHPAVKSLPDRMRDGLSVFDPQVRVPAACRDLRVLPDAFADWCRELFAHRHRDAPPSLIPSSRARRRRSTPVGSSAPSAPLADEFDAAILDVVRVGSHTAVRTEHSLYIDAVRLGTNLEHAVGLWVGPAAAQDPPALLVVHHDPGERRLWLARPQSGEPDLPIEVAAQDLCVRADAIFVRCGTAVMEVRLSSIGSRLVATQLLRTRVLPHASRLFDGVAHQSIEGATVLSLLQAGRTRQLRVPQLDGFEIIDAALAADTAVLLTTREGRCGQLDQWTLELCGSAPGYRALYRPDVEPREIAWSTDLSGDVVWSTPAYVHGTPPGPDPHGTAADFRPVCTAWGVGWARGRTLCRMRPVGIGADRGSTGAGLRQRLRRKSPKPPSNPDTCAHVHLRSPQSTR